VTDGLSELIDLRIVCLKACEDFSISLACSSPKNIIKEVEPQAVTVDSGYKLLRMYNDSVLVFMIKPTQKNDRSKNKWVRSYERRDKDK
jgi:hypothetical protein